MGERRSRESPYLNALHPADYKHCITFCKTKCVSVNFTTYTQPASNLGPLSARQRNAIRMAFRWRADGGPILHAYWACGYVHYVTHTIPLEIKLLSESFN